MNKFTCELKSAFIFNKEKRAAFREKYIEILHPEIAQRRTFQKCLTILQTHEESFKDFKNIYSGRDVVVVAGGPSAKQYTTPPSQDAIHICVNAAYRSVYKDFDYLFFQDGWNRPEMVEEVNNYSNKSNKKCIKFYGVIDEKRYGVNDATISQSAANSANARRYFVTQGKMVDWAWNITSQPLADYGSVVFPAIQFALWTNPKRLFLVGCDCTNSGYAYGQSSNKLNVDNVVKGYQDMKLFVKKWYPKTEIISINPIGLKGLFTDQYQE